MDVFDRSLLFKSVVDQGSLAAAARQMSISPSVVSKRLAELERHLDVQLLRRTTRRISLTEAGERFYGQIRCLSRQWQTLLDETTDLGQEPKGQLVIAAPQPVLSRVLMPLVSEFRRQYESIELILQSVVYEQLPLFDADLSVCRQLQGFNSAEMVGVPLCEYRNSLYASELYLQRQGGPGGIEELASHQCLVYGLEGKGTWAFASGQQVMVSGALRTNNTEVIIQAAAQHQGVAYIPEVIIRDELVRRQLVPVLPEQHSDPFQVYCYYQKMDYVPVKVRLFINFLKDHLPEII
ncbi:LysR family transcriptional regulator [Motiliproteus sp. MSK22-1]|uniref:LysR family transcriptional regulator n=1 Tax=Motiliproteus sp. MSK22-1 TaxID=1897630 RepID=UPI000978C13E|nr:LysR family transcriptional regulator [Motiliproteus sp. MSK22-1]OMH29083.1 LysR family transcriptional regulator [Motiliproteus sp. MSK22-1]